MNKVSIVFKKYLIILLFLFSINCFSQFVYYGDSRYSNDIVYVIKNNKIYSGQYELQSNIVANFDGHYLYRGYSRYSNDIIATYNNGKIYKGKSTYLSDLLVNYSNGKMYIGNSNYSNKVLCNIRNNKIYKYNSSYNSDIIFRCSDYIHPIFIYFIIENTIFI